MNMRTTPPVWFWLVAVLLALWGLSGCYACLQQFRLGAEAMGPPTDYQRELYASLPGWYNYLYAVAVGTMLLGALLLLGRSQTAVPVYIVSLAAVLVQFGYLFATSDIVARMGFGTAAGFPIVIALIGVFAIWFATLARRRGWIA